MDSSTPKHVPLAQRRWPWLVLLILSAIVYYGSYYRHGINFRDEGGTLTLAGQRLLNGELPFRDVDLGYNVGWFVPIVALFKITGVNFVALRVYFFVLCTLAALLGFLTVHRAATYSGRSRLASPLGFLVGLVLLLVPGMIFKNYNPLAVVANAWCLLGFILAGEVREANWRALVGGLVLGATWTIRLDLGTFCTVLWLGVLLARLPGPRSHWRARYASSAMALGIVLGCVAVVHVPFLWDAYRRDYAKQFIAAYPSHWKYLWSKLPGRSPRPLALPAQPAPSLVKSPAEKAAPLAPDAAPLTAPTPPKAAAAPADTQVRTTWADVSSSSGKDYQRNLGLFILTYFPFLTLIPLVGWAFVRWLKAARTGADPRIPLAALALLGSSLTLFPQFFFWRADAPHLSEFGPGYWVAVVGATLLLSTGMRWRSPVLIFTILLTVHAGVWFWRMFPDRWCGTIFARVNRTILIEGENGARVYEQKDKDDPEPWITTMLRLIRAHSEPGEFLVAYPYHPAFNVLANRPTYERNVYMDNAKASAQWSADAIERIKTKKPAIIIIGDWDINSTEESRFRNWAAPVCEYVRANYELLDTFDKKKEKFELYARKGTVATPPPSRTPVDDALSFALEAAQPYLKEGFTVREDYWGGDMAVKQAKAITHQLFKGNTYWFWMGTDEKDAKISVHVYDSDGNLCEEEFQQKTQMAMARVIPKRTGTYYLIVEIESSPKERTHWGMAYGFQ